MYFFVLSLIVSYYPICHEWKINNVNGNWMCVCKSGFKKGIGWKIRIKKMMD